MGFNRSAFAARLAGWEGPPSDLTRPAPARGAAGEGSAGEGAGVESPPCVRLGSVVGGHRLYGGIGPTAGRELPRLEAFRRAVAKTIEVHEGQREGRRAGAHGERRGAGAGGAQLLLVVRKGIRKFVNEKELLSGELEARLFRATGLKMVSVRLERLSVEEQFSLVQRTRVLVGNHGAGLTWAAMLPPGGTVVELHANASTDALPIDIRHFANARACATWGCRRRRRRAAAAG